MLRSLPLLLLMALVLGCSNPDGDPSGTSFTPLERFIADAVDEVDAERLFDSMSDLTGIHSRFMHFDPGAAATVDWLMATLDEQGCSAEADSFSFLRIRWIHTANVAARFTGLTRPEEVILVGAHWDCVDYPEGWSQDSSLRAPGAIDNASGVSAVMELARILVDLPLERSVKVIFFAAEEVGMQGSRRERDFWLGEAEGDSLACLINVDMLGQDPDAFDAHLICDSISAPLAVELLPWARRATCSTRIDTLLAGPGNWHGGSDHLQFWYRSLPAIWLHEGPGDAFPLANTEADELSELTPDFLTDGTRALVAAVLALAVPITE